MIKSKLELFLDGVWTSYDIYNQLMFDERRDGQLRSASCYIMTTEKKRFKPMRKARVTVIDTLDNTTKQMYYFAYFKGQQRGHNYWLHEVTLIDPAKRVQGEMINGLRVVQDDSNSITLYATLQRLCNTTPLRLTSQSNKYNPTDDEAIVELLQAIPSPEYSWSCRTLFWECLKEVGMDMGGYLPKIEFGDNGTYIISFYSSSEVVKTITESDLNYISYAEGIDESQVCSEIDTDIANIIATNQGTASVVFPSQVGWITPRTDDVQLTSGNCEIQMPNIIEKPLRILIKTDLIDVRGSKPDEAAAGMDLKLSEVLNGRTELDITEYIPEYKKYGSLDKKNTATYEGDDAEVCWNNTSYWTEGTNVIKLVTTDTSVNEGNAFSMMIKCAVYSKYSINDPNFPSELIVDGMEAHLYSVETQDPRSMQFRVEYIPRDNSTKLKAVKQEKCDYIYSQPYNQRAEIVDAVALSRELKKTVNQMGVNYIDIVNIYDRIGEILQVGTALKDGNDSYILTVNEYEQTSHDNVKVKHTFSKNWALQSEYLKQNKEYRNTRIPTDILERNLHYQDYIVISDKQIDGETGILTAHGLDLLSRVFGDRVDGEYTEVNNFALYGNSLDGVIVSSSSFGCANSIVLSAKMQNNLTAGKKIGDDWYCQDVLYTTSNGTFFLGNATIQFGTLDFLIVPNELPHSANLPIGSVNGITTPVVEGTFFIDKSSAEHTNYTYQLPFVSDLPEVLVGGLIAENNPLVRDLSEDLKFQLWGLTVPLAKTATYVNAKFGTKIADITTDNKSSYWTLTLGSQFFTMALKFAGKMAGNYIGWALTDEKGRLYMARNSNPNEDQTLYFNLLHNYHEED